MGHGIEVTVSESFDDRVRGGESISRVDLREVAFNDAGNMACVHVSLGVRRHHQKFRGQIAPAEMVLQALCDNRFIDSGGEGIVHESE